MRARDVLVGSRIMDRDETAIRNHSSRAVQPCDSGWLATTGDLNNALQVIANGCSTTLVSGKCPYCTSTSGPR